MNDRKSQIIRLALKLIQEKGYASISYNDLSRQLGITKASIHYHFEKKVDLGVAVCDALLQTHRGWHQQIEKMPLTSLEKLWSYMSIITEHIQQKQICPISSFQTDFEALPPAIQQKVQQLSQLELDYIIERLSEAKKEREFQADNIEALANLVLTSLKGAIQYERVLGGNIVTQVIDQFKHSLH